MEKLYFHFLRNGFRPLHSNLTGIPQIQLPVVGLESSVIPKNNVIALNLTSYGFSGELGPRDRKLEIHSIH